MYIPAKSSTVVIVGRWNPFIFTPNWAAKHIFEEPKIRAELAVGPVNVVRLSGDCAEIVPSSNRVTISALHNSRECLERIEVLSRRLLVKLPHTPIEAIGVNHAFVEPFAQPDLLSLFNLQDEANLLTFEQAKIGRTLAASDHKVNFEISKNHGEDKVQFKMNFHYIIGTEQNPATVIAEGLIQKHFQYSIELLQEKYKLTMDQSENPEEDDG